MPDPVEKGVDRLDHRPSLPAEEPCAIVSQAETILVIAPFCSRFYPKALQSSEKMPQSLRFARRMAATKSRSRARPALGSKGCATRSKHCQRHHPVAQRQQCAPVVFCRLPSRKRRHVPDPKNEHLAAVGVGDHGRLKNLHGSGPAGPAQRSRAPATSEKNACRAAPCPVDRCARALRPDHRRQDRGLPAGGGSRPPSSRRRCRISTSPVVAAAFGLCRSRRRRDLHRGLVGGGPHGRQDQRGGKAKPDLTGPCRHASPPWRPGWVTAPSRAPPTSLAIFPQRARFRTASRAGLSTRPCAPPVRHRSAPPTIRRSSR